MGIALLLGVLLASSVAVRAGFRINVSDSMPNGLYRLVDCGPAARHHATVGDVVALDLDKASRNPNVAFFHCQGWLGVTGRGDDLLMKRIVAVGGDEVTEREGEILVNGTPLGSLASNRAHTVEGLSLPRPRFPQVLDQSQVWLSSDHPRGIDSRYFGPVTRAAIACQVEALWTF